MFGKALRYGALHVDVNARDSRATNAVACTELRVSLIDCFTYMCRNVATYGPAIVRCSVLRTRSFRLSRFEHASITLHAWCACTFKGKEHARFAPETRRPPRSRSDDASGDFENIRSRRADGIYFARWTFTNSSVVRDITIWFMYRALEKSQTLSYNAYIICIRKRAKRMARLLIFSWQPNIAFIFCWRDSWQKVRNEYRNVVIWLIWLN